MYNFLLQILFLLIFNVNTIFASNIISNQEDTIRYNVYKLRNHNQALILHAALEGPNAIVGGLGSVMRDLGNKLKDDFNNSFIVTPYYNFLKESLPNKGKVTSLGFIEHFLFNRSVTTEVFFNEASKQFLFHPDFSIQNCCDIVTGIDKIYEPTQNFLRIIFFNSAIAKFADVIDADVAQLHAWQTSLSAALIKKNYNPHRRELGLKEIKIISTIHMFSQEQGLDSGAIYKFVGLQTPEDDVVNLAATSILESDCLTTVSQGLTTYFTDPITSYGLESIFRNKQGFIYGITNGIDYANFNPFLEQNLGEFHLKENFSPQELKNSKNKAKNILYEKGLISFSSKPLMLYVGRFSDEKGNSYLEPIVEKWLSMGGQMVLMGILTQDQRAAEEILLLRDKQKENPLLANNLKIYTDLRTDQLDFISQELQIQKGRLIRYSADFVCIPSKVESCGLVSMESLSFGTPVFTSWVQGLKDMCFPYAVYHPLLNKIVDKTDFNAISFEYRSQDKLYTLQDINRNLELAFKITTGEEFGLESLLDAQKRIIDQAKYFDWQAPEGAVQKYAELYKGLIGNSHQIPQVKTYSESVDQDHLVQRLIDKFGMYPPNKMMFKYEKFQPLLLTTLMKANREAETEYNLSNLKELSRVKIQDKKLYVNNAESTLFDTDELRNQNKSFYATWVLNKKGELFAGALCHAYILKSKPGSPNYGYAKPVAGAGDIIVKNGEITYIDNRSGHYMPYEDQYLVALHYLDSLGLINEKCNIREEKTGKQISLETVRNSDILEVLSRYPTLEKI